MCHLCGARVRTLLSHKCRVPPGSVPPVKKCSIKSHMTLRGAVQREQLNRGVSKPGCFPLFSGKVQIVSRTLSGLFLVGALNRPRRRKVTNRENPRSPSKSGKSKKNRESPKEDKKGTKKGQKRKDKSRSGNPPV